MEPILLTVKEAADALRIGRTLLYEMIGRQELPVVRIGRAVRVPADSLYQWVDQHRRPARETSGAAQ